MNKQRDNFRSCPKCFGIGFKYYDFENVTRICFCCEGKGRTKVTRWEKVSSDTYILWRDNRV